MAGAVGGGGGMAARLRELFSKYGKVALAVHFSVSSLSIGGFYVAIQNHVDVESALQKTGLIPSPSPPPSASVQEAAEEALMGGTTTVAMADEERKTKKADALLSGGGALALAILCNKALLPVRVPITIALTPPISRFLSRRSLLGFGAHKPPPS